MSNKTFIQNVCQIHELGPFISLHSWVRVIYLSHSWVRAIYLSFSFVLVVSDRLWWGYIFWSFKESLWIIFFSEFVLRILLGCKCYYFCYFFVLCDFDIYYLYLLLDFSDIFVFSLQYVLYCHICVANWFVSTFIQRARKARVRAAAARRVVYAFDHITLGWD